MDNDTLKAKLTAKLRLENILSDFENADINESDILELKNKFKEIKNKKYYELTTNGSNVRSP